VRAILLNLVGEYDKRTLTHHTALQFFLGVSPAGSGVAAIRDFGNKLTCPIGRIFEEKAIVGLTSQPHIWLKKAHGEGETFSSSVV
jgi:hypothetical protein